VGCPPGLSFSMTRITITRMRMQGTARTYAKDFYRDKDLGTCQKNTNSKGAGIRHLMVNAPIRKAKHEKI